MDQDTRKADLVHTKDGQRRLPKNIRVNFKLDAVRARVLKDIEAQGMFPDRTSVIEWLIDNYQFIDRARQIVDTRIAIVRLEDELEKLSGAGK